MCLLQVFNNKQQKTEFRSCSFSSLLKLNTKPQIIGEFWHGLKLWCVPIPAFTQSMAYIICKDFLSFCIFVLGTIHFWPRIITMTPLLVTQWCYYNLFILDHNKFTSLQYHLNKFHPAKIAIRIKSNLICSLFYSQFLVSCVIPLLTMELYISLSNCLFKGCRSNRVQAMAIHNTPMRNPMTQI